MINISKTVTNIFNSAVLRAFQLNDFSATVSWSQVGTSELTSPSAIGLYNKNKTKWSHPSSKEIAEEIISNIEPNDLISSIQAVSQITQEESKKPESKVEEKKTDSNTTEEEGKKKQQPKKAEKKEKPVAPPGYFMNININEKWIEKTAMHVLKHGINIKDNFQKKKVLVDFSAPNIAKEMHVGHLRSTIIGDSICRILEYLGHEVLRINHVGDWGTQFGMLISYLEEAYPDFLNNMPEIKDLEQFYVSAKKKFESDEVFKKTSYENTVKLQTGDAHCHKAWKIICDVSRNEFNKVYTRLGVSLVEMGESFYNQKCRDLIPKLEEAGYVIVDQGAKILRVPGIKLPMMIVKSDGGLTYDTTDLAAIHYRLTELKCDWIIYVIASEQDAHLKLLFQAAQLIGWHKPPSTRCDHMGFGLVLGADGKKIATRNGGSVKLIDLLDEGKKRAFEEIEKRHKEHNITGFTSDELENTAKNIGYSAIKYYDLKQNRKSTYKFDFDHMLDAKGNTAVYLFYAYARICSIYRKEGLSNEHLDKLIHSHEIKIVHPLEKSLLVNVLKFQDVIEDVLEDLSLNKLTDYLYDITVKFTEFYQNCDILNNENTNSRIMIIELTRRFMKVCFDLIGMEPVERI